MHYVKQFHINGIDTKQIACIELQGPPNAATEGAVGVLGMDITSPTHEVYRCVAVNGCVYTWELLSAGMSIMSSTETGGGALGKAFSYTSLRFPVGYLVKRGDLIIDSEGYLYRVTVILAESCHAEYCGTRLGGIGGEITEADKTEIASKVIEVVRPELDGKLDRSTETYKVYCTDVNGNTIMLSYTDRPQTNGRRIVVYTNNGTLRTNTATEDNETIPLAQMNEALSTLPSKSEVETLTKKVANLEAGVSGDMFTIDDTTAYIKDIPADVAPYAELRSVGGMVHSHEAPAPNLLVDSVLAQENGKEYDDGYGNGCTFYRDAEGKYSVYPLVEYPVSQSYYTEHTFGEIFPNAEVGKRYIFTYDLSEPWDEYWSGGSISIPSVYNGVPFTLTEAIRNSRIDFYCASHYDGTMERAQTETFSNISLVEEGGGEIYFTDTKVTSIVSLDANGVEIHRIVIPSEVQAFDGYGKTDYRIEWDDEGKAWWVAPGAEPTDISHLFTGDNLIPVEGGGVIVANNANEEAAPTTIVYQTRDFLASTYDAFDEVHAYAQTLKGGAT